MIKRNFLNNIRRGLGRGYLELASAENKEEYKETLWYACFNDSSYEFVVEGSKGEYLFRLIQLYEDNIYFKESIIKFLKNKLPDRDLFAQLLDILFYYHLDGDRTIKPFLNEYYTAFLTKGKWTKNKTLCYEYLCIIMDRVFGIKKSMRILEDIEKLKINREYLFWFLGRMHYKYEGNEKVDSFSPEPHKKTYTHTFEEFLQESKSEQTPYAFSFWASDAEYEKCISYLQQTKDEKDIITILRDFQQNECPKKIPEEVLFSLINLHGEEVDAEIYCTLSYMQSQRVESLALRLLQDGKHTVSAIHMLMNNYKKQYREILVDAYKKIQFSFYNWTPLISYTIDFMCTKKKDLPDEILFYAYEKSYDAFYREYVVDCMKKRKLLTKEILNELQYDSDYEIRRKAVKWLRSI